MLISWGKSCIFPSFRIYFYPVQWSLMANLQLKLLPVWKFWNYFWLANYIIYSVATGRSWGKMLCIIPLVHESHKVLWKNHDPWNHELYVMWRNFNTLQKLCLGIFILTRSHFFYSRFNWHWYLPSQTNTCEMEV
jgi:hypothetical protein